LNLDVCLSRRRGEGGEGTLCEGAEAEGEDCCSAHGAWGKGEGGVRGTSGRG
jgi:hypothetical protein